MKALELVRKAFPTVASAVLLALAFPPANVSLLVLVALAPWFAYLRDTDAKGAKKSGYLFGLVFFGYQMFWLVPFVSTWTGSYLLAAIPWLAATALGSCYFMLVGWLVHRCWATKKPWGIPLVWAGVEGFRSYIMVLAFPWGIVGMPLWKFPGYVQHAAWGTIFLVSATVVLLNVVVASFIWPPKDEKQQLPMRTIVHYLITVVAFVLLSLMRFSTTQAGEKRVYTVVQTGVDVAFGDPLTREDDLQEAIDMAIGRAILHGSQTVVFPEGVGARSSSMPPGGPFDDEPPLPVLFGGNWIEGEDIYQTAFAYDGEWKYANKTRLVIFGEFVPLRDTLPFLQSFDLPSGDLTPAKELTTLEIDGVKTGALICFEGVFPDLAERHSRNGAQVLAVMSIDDWYAGTMAYDQLWMSSVWRSIESGLPLLRSASTGVSLVTDMRGRVMARADEGEMETIRAEVVVPPSSDAFQYRFGFVWIGWLMIAWVYFERYFGRNRKSGY